MISRRSYASRSETNFQNSPFLQHPARHFPEKLAARPFERTNAYVDSRVVSAQLDSRVASYTVVDWSMRAFYAMDNLAHVGLKTRSGKMVGETAMEQRPAKRSTKRRR